MARLHGAIPVDLGVLREGHLVETARVDLVDRYIGATAPKTAKVFRSALGGTLLDHFRPPRASPTSATAAPPAGRSRP